MPEMPKRAAKAIKDAASDEVKRETETSGLTPDQETPMKPQETGNESLGRHNWPFPPASVPEDD
jgi:hypothetical protein